MGKFSYFAIRGNYSKMSQISKARYLFAFLLSPPLGAFFIGVIIYLLTGNVPSMLRGNFFEEIGGFILFSSLLGGYPAMLLIGFPAIIAIEKTNSNGVISYVLAGMAAGFIWGGLLLGKGNFFSDFGLLGGAAGFSCSFIAYFFIHFPKFKLIGESGF